jgi:cbb3-type cytochrome oxidase maturation protein
MSIAYLLIPLGILLMAGAAVALFWAADNGQFEDLDAAGRSVLEEDDGRPPEDSAPR